jgi:hypothetical protein
VLAFLAACSKSNSSNDNALADGTVQFKLNGNLITFHNSNDPNGDYVKFGKYFSRTAVQPFHTYLLDAWKLDGNDQYGFGLYIVSDSLQVWNYDYDSTVLRFNPAGGCVHHNFDQSCLLWSGDYIHINITSYANGFVSGKFNAKLSPVVRVANGSLLPFNMGTTLITEGFFKNIPCNYH